MSNLLMFVAPIFPYDPSIDSQKEHLHLILIYAVVWGTQLAYAGFAIYRRRVSLQERIRKDV